MGEGGVGAGGGEPALGKRESELREGKPSTVKPRAPKAPVTACQGKISTSGNLGFQPNIVFLKLVIGMALWTIKKARRTSPVGARHPSSPVQKKYHG